MEGYFTDNELACRCCGRLSFDPTFRCRLDVARHFAEVPFVVNSGYRCWKHNKEVGSTETSSHLVGLAVDIKAEDSVTRFAILRALIFVGFSRIGIRKDFVHVDADLTKKKEVVWIY